MIEFNLEQALAGDKVITRNGEDVTQIAVFYTGNCELICGVINGAFSPYLQKSDLFMAPKMLSGFVNVWVGDNGKVVAHVHKNIVDASCEHSDTSKKLACIDLSVFQKEHGID